MFWNSQAWKIATMRLRSFHLTEFRWIGLLLLFFSMMQCVTQGNARKVVEKVVKTCSLLSDSNESDLQYTISQTEGKFYAETFGTHYFNCSYSAAPRKAAICIAVSPQKHLMVFPFMYGKLQLLLPCYSSVQQIAFFHAKSDTKWSHVEHQNVFTECWT